MRAACLGDRRAAQWRCGAGIGYVEVVAGDTPAELRRVVERLVQKGS